MKQMLLNINLDWRNFKYFSDLDGRTQYCKLSDIIPWGELDVLFNTTTQKDERNAIN